jgi:hypothetical protein
MSTLTDIVNYLDTINNRLGSPSPSISESHAESSTMTSVPSLLPTMTHPICPSGVFAEKKHKSCVCGTNTEKIRSNINPAELFCRVITKTD